MAANGASSGAAQTTPNTTRVFKKSSPNGKITTYLGKRDFIDSGSAIDPVDGVVLIDPEYVANRKVYANILAAFRYGREDLDVLGLTFRKDLFVSTIQVYPPDDDTLVSPLTAKLMKKLGSNAYPFFFELPVNSPSSVTLQPSPDDTGKPCGVDFELKTYVAENEQEKTHKRNSVRLAIRKLTYAPDESAPQPRAEVVKDFMLSSGKLRVEASLDKEKYYHGENIAVNVTIDNNSNKKIKKIHISVTQISDIILFSKASYKCNVAELESEEGMPVLPNQSGFCKVYYLCPTLDNNRDKRGLALDGKLKHEDTNLASSTIIRENANREHLGIVVQYRVRVRLLMGILNTNDVTLELPFTLTHPKPDSPPPSRPISVCGDGAVDTNLIQLEEGNDNACDDDIIFEDFARLRLKGDEADDTEG